MNFNLRDVLDLEWGKFFFFLQRLNEERTREYNQLKGSG